MTQDDDDWVGTPPEGRHSRDRADPAHWRQGFPVATAASCVLGVLILVAIVVALTA